MDIYIVEARFQTYDSYYAQIVGIFDDQQIAEIHKNKWLFFFKNKYKEIFEPFLELRDEEGDWINDEVEDDYYRKKEEYSCIFRFCEIVVVSQLKLNEDLLMNKIETSYRASDKEYDLMKQFSIEYNREYNLNKLISE
jgi:hypothetical protein